MNVTAFHEGRHLAEAELGPEEPQCPMCGSTERSALLRLQDAPTVELLRCHRCNGASASRFPTDAALDAYYAAYYSPEDSGPAVTMDSPAALARAIARAVPTTQHRGEPFRILDFGGGDGTIALAVAEVLGDQVGPVSITIVEHAEGPLPASTTVEISRTAELGDVRGSYDLVMASAVLEHIASPLPILDALFARTRIGGTVYVRTPQVAGLIRLAARAGVAVDFTFPGHIHDLGESFWGNLLSWWEPTGATAALTLSRPSPVESTLRLHPGRTAMAAVAKAPWWLLRSRWEYVGGWQAAFTRVN